MPQLQYLDRIKYLKDKPPEIVLKNYPTTRIERAAKEIAREIAEWFELKEYTYSIKQSGE